jgi:hypothetical protein
MTEQEAALRRQYGQAVTVRLFCPQCNRYVGLFEWASGTRTLACAFTTSPKIMLVSRVSTPLLGVPRLQRR